MSQSVSLNEFIEQGYELEKLKPYEDFLIECSQKDYLNQGTHEHHILPRFMEGSNAIDNLISLSYEDHFNAHLILANCFVKKTKENWRNITSANYILGNAKRSLKCVYGEDFNFYEIDFWKEASIVMKILYSGENNYNYNRPKTKETIQKQSNSLKKFYLENGSHHTGMKRSAECCEKISISRLGRFVGENSPCFGVKRNPISDETRKLLTDKNRESTNKRFPLPDGVFKFDEDKVIENKRFYRFCECGYIISFAARGIAIRSHDENRKCRNCLGKRYKEEYTNRKLEKSTKTKTILLETGEIIELNFKCKILQDSKTQIIYKTKRSAYKDLKISSEKLEELIQIGRFRYLEYSEIPKDKQKHHKQKSIKDLRSGIIYSSITSLCKELDMKYGSVTRRLKLGIFELIFDE